MILFVFSLLFYNCFGQRDRLPVVINTWAFTNANAAAVQVLAKGGTVIDAVEAGCSTCEKEQCDGTVGFGGSPDEAGETTLDAMIMDGASMDAGAVAALRNVKSAVSVARHVMEYTDHTLLVGSQASRFAFEMGFAEESLATNASMSMYEQWRSKDCQPNFWTNVIPDPATSCGPYKPIKQKRTAKSKTKISNSWHKKHHDTIGMVVIDPYRRPAVATSTNGAAHKIPGRVGDSPIIGAGGYALYGVGGAAATGDGDVLMRYLPSFKAVEAMKMGIPPKDAAVSALAGILEHEQDFVGAIIVARIDGQFAAACYGMGDFPYTVTFGNQTIPTVVKVSCIKPFRSYGRL